MLCEVQNCLVGQLQCVCLENSLQIEPLLWFVVLVHTNLECTHHIVCATTFKASLKHWEVVSQPDSLQRPYFGGFVYPAVAPSMELEESLSISWHSPEPKIKWKMICLRQCIFSRIRKTLSLMIQTLKSVFLWGNCFYFPYPASSQLYGLDLHTISIQLSLQTDLLHRPRAMFSSLTNLTTASFLKSRSLYKRELCCLSHNAH